MQVLRRYLLFSRALVAVPLAAVQGLKPHQLDDQAVAVLAAKSLSQQPWHRYDSTLKLGFSAVQMSPAGSRRCWRLTCRTCHSLS
jgi:hypothetical protein